MRKLHLKFCGQFPILQFITDVAVKLGLPAPIEAQRIHDSFHVSLLKPYTEDSFKRNPRPLPPLKFSDRHEYEMDKILAERSKYGKKQFLVKYKSYPDHENIWETETNIDCKDILNDYKASRRRSI